MILERILSDNEKIRRAEEIYYRRNNRNVKVSNNEPKRQKTYLGSKILLEMLILIIMAVAVFAVKNKDYIFTQEFLASFSQYNVNLTEKLGAFFMGNEAENTEQIFINNEQTQNVVQENTTQQVPQEAPVQSEQQNNAEVVQTQSSEVQPAQGTGAVIDVEMLKNSYSFVKPLEGVVTSGFGSRESQYQNVKGEHKGIDIGADSGTKIKSAMTGVVSQVSSEGDYGNHVKITQNNVTTLYAHCQDIYVVEGQEIQMGQEIASVGSTGNSTGPHLHFEIRIDDVAINPVEIIDF